MNGLLIQWGYKDLLSDVPITISIINYTSADSYTILTSIANTNNKPDKWNYPLCIYGRSPTSFAIISNSNVAGGRFFYFCIGY